MTAKPTKHRRDNIISDEELIKRMPLPDLKNNTKVLGLLEQRLGAGHLRVRCFDGHTRVCRVPGKYKRRLWLREGDIVLVIPWEFKGDEKGDIVYKYRKSQIEWLKRKGYLDKLEDDFGGF